MTARHKNIFSVSYTFRLDQYKEAGYSHIALLGSEVLTKGPHSTIIDRDTILKQIVFRIFYCFSLDLCHFISKNYIGILTICYFWYTIDTI